jgi:hypothetical protein
MEWRAKWIWSPGEAAPRNFYWCVRKEFELPKRFERVEVALSADTRYVLWFNGYWSVRVPCERSTDIGTMTSTMLRSGRSRG